MTKSEILFYYESRQNPNGDPDADNQPRLMHDQTIMVTDVRIKRTIRDYAKEKFGYTLFVDFQKDGLPDTADSRAIEIVGKDTKDYIEALLEKTFDVPLFGGLVTIRNKKPKNDEKKNDDEDKSGSQKLTGPVQFGIGRSINPVNIIQPAITSRFIGDASKGRHTTIGRFYSVEYALIKIQGAINPTNLTNKYLQNPHISKLFKQYSDQMPQILWEGTNQLVTRSKYPQKSILYIQIDYKDSLYNDISELMSENKSLREQNIQDLGKNPFDFTNFIKIVNERKDEIEQIRVKYTDEIADDVNKALSQISEIKIDKF